MADLLLRETEQRAVRAVIASEPVPGALLPGARVLHDLARLIDCDALGVAVLDGTGGALGEDELLPQGLVEDPPSGAALVGLHHRERSRTVDGTGGHRGVAVLSLGVRRGQDHVITLWMARSTSDFSHRDRALFRLVAPAMERLLRERPTCSLPPPLTLQERRVLHLVGTGMSNAEIAARLVVAPCTVRKHLENAYRKLHVTNRLAAVNAVEPGRVPMTDPSVTAGTDA